MSEFEQQASIPLQSMQSPRASKVDAPTRTWSGHLQRWALSVGVFAAIGVVGWGSWRILHTEPTVDDEESIADLEGFERPGATDSDETSAGGVMPPTQETQPRGMMTSIAVPPLPADLFPMSDPPAAADVWLTGTIEDASSPDTMEAPPKLSTDPAESTVVR